jgi:hypothetical protein
MLYRQTYGNIYIIHERNRRYESRVHEEAKFKLAKKLAEWMRPQTHVSFYYEYSESPLVPWGQPGDKECRITLHVESSAPLPEPDPEPATR